MKSTLKLTSVLSLTFMLLSSFNSSSNLNIGVILSGGGDWLVDPNGGGRSATDSEVPCVEIEDHLDFEYGLNVAGQMVTDYESNLFIHDLKIKLFDCETGNIIITPVYMHMDYSNPSGYVPQNPELQGSDLTGVHTIYFPFGFPDYCGEGNEDGYVTANLCLEVTPYNFWVGDISTPHLIEDLSINICCDETPIREPEEPIHDFSARNIDLSVDPFLSELFVKEGLQSNDDIGIYNTSGALVYFMTLDSDRQKVKLRTGHLSSGIYFLRVFRDNHNFQAQTIFKR